MGRLVGEEGGEFLFGGRKPGEIEGGAAEESGFIGWRRGFEAFLFEAGEDELIDGVERPIFLLGNGRGGGGERLEGPEIFVGIGDHAAQSHGADAGSSERIAGGCVAAGAVHRQLPIRERRRWFRGEALPCGGILIWFS